MSGAPAARTRLSERTWPQSLPRRAGQAQAAGHTERARPARRPVFAQDRVLSHRAPRGGGPISIHHEGVDRDGHVPGRVAAQPGHDARREQVRDPRRAPYRKGTRDRVIDAGRRRGPAEIVGGPHLEAIEPMAGRKPRGNELARAAHRGRVETSGSWRGTPRTGHGVDIGPHRVAVAHLEAERGPQRDEAVVRSGEHAAAGRQLSHRWRGVDIDVHPGRGDGVAVGVDEVDRQEMSSGELVRVRAQRGRGLEAAADRGAARSLERRSSGSRRRCRNDTATALRRRRPPGWRSSDGCRSCGRQLRGLGVADGSLGLVRIDRAPGGADEGDAGRRCACGKGE